MSLQSDRRFKMGWQLKSVMMLSTLLALPVLSQAASTSEESCRLCHKMEGKLIGPSFKEIAARYANEPDVIAHLKQSMLNGSSGRWGEIPMPPNAGLTETEAQSFSYWIMSLNKPAGKAESGAQSTQK